MINSYYRPMANFSDMKRTFTNRKKKTKNMQRYFTVKKIQITLKHMTRCWISIMKQEMQSKAIMKYNFLTSTGESKNI